MLRSTNFGRNPKPNRGQRAQSTYSRYGTSHGYRNAPYQRDYSEEDSMRNPYNEMDYSSDDYVDPIYKEGNLEEAVEDNYENPYGAPYEQDPYMRRGRAFSGSRVQEAAQMAGPDDEAILEEIDRIKADFRIS